MMASSPKRASMLFPSAAEAPSASEIDFTVCEAGNLGHSWRMRLRIAGFSHTQSTVLIVDGLPVQISLFSQLSSVTCCSPYYDKPSPAPPRPRDTSPPDCARAAGDRDWSHGSAGCGVSLVWLMLVCLSCALCDALCNVLDKYGARKGVAASANS
jgi:hypothetical protein